MDVRVQVGDLVARRVEQIRQNRMTQLPGKADLVLAGGGDAVDVRRDGSMLSKKSFCIIGLKS
jgi:hypothetical protein